jgi:hypothetical protein
LLDRCAGTEFLGCVIGRNRVEQLAVDLFRAIENSGDGGIAEQRTQ